VKFTKMQGAGNDFVLVETSDMQRDWSRLAVTMCDRHFGIGADGLLLLLPSERADFRMRIINPDGTEAEACGNGLRCLVKYVIDRGMANSRVEEISVETMAGIREVKAHRVKGRLTEIQVSMGVPELKIEDIPVAIGAGNEGIVDIKSMTGYSLAVHGEELLLNFVSMGNPHAVYFWQRPASAFPLSRLGPEVEKHRIFPSAVNFEVARVINRQHVEARVWEKGVGETLACGSGACAIAVAARLYDYTDSKVDIKLPGGTLSVEWDGAGEVLLSGPAETVFTGEWPDEV
jgi:diaminopimelate epimerase